MARIARVVMPGVPHHITQRDNRRLQTFFCDEDYEAYIALAHEVTGRLLGPERLIVMLEEAPLSASSPFHPPRRVVVSSC